MKTLLIENENGRQDRFSASEIRFILRAIRERFGAGFFPLANNVEKLGNGTEQMGLGRIVLEHESSDVTHAQASSYLGVVLEEGGYLRWNGRHSGIEWRLLDTDFELDSICGRLSAANTRTA